jgi:hypothetical protein
MRQLWLRMTEIYGHKWTSAYGEDAESGAGETWAIGLSGLDARDINTGLSAAITSNDPWPPTLPQFRAMCLGIPTLAAVMLAIRTKAKATPFLVMLWQNLDSYRLRQASADQADRLVRDAYELTREHVMQGRALPPVPEEALAQEKPEPKFAPPHVVERHIETIEERLRAGEPDDADGSEVPA